MKECDIFGRTCFFNAIDYITPIESNLCPQCQSACEFMEYRKSNVKEQEMNLDEIYGWDRFQDSPCSPVDICEYLHDTNDTIEPITWYEQFIADDDESQFMKPKIKDAKRLLNDHIIVHVNFASAKVEINELDARYSIYTKLSNLGGTIGLCEQLTGASFLTLIHLMVLTCKFIFRWRCNPKQ